LLKGTTNLFPDDIKSACEILMSIKSSGLASSYVVRKIKDLESKIKDILLDMEETVIYECDINKRSY
jgi:hypothetical protein